MFNKVFAEIPVGRTTSRHWAAQDPAVLNAAAAVIEAHAANAWVFSADARHFWEFAGASEVAAYQALTKPEFAALCGDWEDGDHDPENFGYSWP